jgi:hypothetical protein
MPQPSPGSPEPTQPRALYFIPLTNASTSALLTGLR